MKSEGVRNGAQCGNVATPELFQPSALHFYLALVTLLHMRYFAFLLTIGALLVAHRTNPSPPVGSSFPQELSVRRGV